MTQFWVIPMPSLKDAIIREAHSWIGVKYRHMGRDRLSGVDCAGLIIKVAHGIGISEYDTNNYGRRPIPSEFVRELRNNMDRIEIEEIEHGDVGVFAEPRHPCHCGIVEQTEHEGRWLIHAYAPYRKVIREPLVGNREGRLLMAFRYRGPEGWRRS